MADSQLEPSKSHKKRGGKYKPVGVNTSVGAMIESLIEDVDREPDAHAGVLECEAGTYQGKASIGAFAQATTAQAYAHSGVASAAARGPTVSAGCHCGASGVNAKATAELCRAEASFAGMGVSVGLNADTGVSIGVDGISASVLGFGASLGSKPSLKLPIAEVSCSIM